MVQVKQVSYIVHVLSPVFQAFRPVSPLSIPSNGWLAALHCLTWEKFTRAGGNFKIG